MSLNLNSKKNFTMFHKTACQILWISHLFLIAGSSPVNIYRSLFGCGFLVCVMWGLLLSNNLLLLLEMDHLILISLLVVTTQFFSSVNGKELLIFILILNIQFFLILIFKVSKEIWLAAISIQQWAVIVMVYLNLPCGLTPRQLQICQLVVLYAAGNCNTSIY